MSRNVGTVVYNRDTSQITVAMNGTPSTTHGVLIATVNHLGTVLSQQYVEAFTGSPPAGYGYVPPNPVLADVAANTVYLGGSYVIGANTGTQRVPLIYSMVATATLPPSGSRVDVMNAYLDGGAVANTHTQTVSTLSSVTWSSFSVPFESLSGGATTPTTPLTVTTPVIYDYSGIS